MKTTFTRLMKALMICFATACYTLAVQAQVEYTFSQSTAAYDDSQVDDNGGMGSVNFGFVWDDEIQPEPLGAFPFGESFEFEFNGTAYGPGDDINVSGNGFVVFDPGDTIYAFGADLWDQANVTGSSSTQSPISYAVSGSTPNRILKIEWSNAYFAPDGSFSDYVNVQLWMYESDNRIEVRIGPNAVTAPSYGIYGGPRIGLVSGSERIMLSGSPGSASSTTTYTTLSGTPASGTLYTFAVDTTSGTDTSGNDDNPPPPPVGMSSRSSTPPACSAVVNHGELHISNRSGAPLALQLIDLQGRTVFASTVGGREQRIALSGLPAGLYVVRLSSNSTRHVEKIILR